MGEKGTLYHLAKLAGIMLGLLAIQERALAKSNDLILLPVIAAASVIGYYEIRESAHKIIVASDDRTFRWLREIAVLVISMSAIAIAVGRVAQYLPLPGDIILVAVLFGMAIAQIVAIGRNRLANRRSGDE